MVSMWACTEGLSLGMVKVDDKSNEITAIPKLLKMIDIKGTIVTIDAMGTQTAIAEQIQDNGGDYILALKGNHSTFHDEVENFFNQAEAVEFDGFEHSSYHVIEQGHGRTEKREVYVTEDIKWLPRKEEWKGLKSLIMIVSERTVKGVSSIFRHYYISSLEGDARTVSHSIRSHWGIENSCHWVLDIGFREDEQKAHAGHIAENFAILRRIVLNLLKQDKRKGGIELKRKEAGWDPDYLLELLGVKSF
jgi:predicted transposase YbfD/YdcC